MAGPRTSSGCRPDWAAAPIVWGIYSSVVGCDEPSIVLGRSIVPEPRPRLDHGGLVPQRLDEAQAVGFELPAVRLHQEVRMTHLKDVAGTSERVQLSSLDVHLDEVRNKALLAEGDIVESDVGHLVIRLGRHERLHDLDVVAEGRIVGHIGGQFGGCRRITLEAEYSRAGSFAKTNASYPNCPPTSKQLKPGRHRRRRCLLTSTSYNPRNIRVWIEKSMCKLMPRAIPNRSRRVRACCGRIAALSRGRTLRVTARSLAVGLRRKGLHRHATELVRRRPSSIDRARAPLTVTMARSSAPPRRPGPSVSFVTFSRGRPSVDR